jgi:hypothetical protein
MDLRECFTLTPEPAPGCAVPETETFAARNEVGARAPF